MAKKTFLISILTKNLKESKRIRGDGGWGGGDKTYTNFVPNIIIFEHLDWLFRSSWTMKYFLSLYKAEGKKREEGLGWRSGGWQSPTHHSLEENFFHVKLENIKSLHVIKIRDFGLFIEQDINDKK